MVVAEVPSSPVAILVLDTDPRVAGAIARLLSAAGLEASETTLTEGTEFTAKVATAAHEVVVVRPGAAGIAEVLAAIPILRDQLNRPVIALSSRDALREAAIEHGASDFIHHGVSPEDLLSTIRHRMQWSPCSPLSPRV